MKEKKRDRAKETDRQIDREKEGKGDGERG